MFIDGSHSYDYVKADSLMALRLVRSSGGVIMWHDYGTSYWHGVTRALDDLFAHDPELGGLRHIEGTSLCMLRRGSM